VNGAVGSFAPRYLAIAPVLRADSTSSPLIVQISQNEFSWYAVTAAGLPPSLRSFDSKITVPVTLHLDHTRDFSVIQEAITAGFTSVMIDASDKPLAENIALTKTVVDYAHAHGGSVEAELGRIGRASDENIETDNDEQLYTDPGEARRFVAETGVDALAVSWAQCPQRIRSNSRRSISTGCARSAKRRWRSCCTGFGRCGGDDQQAIGVGE
jgi:fructose-bisphosphate aldolase class II